MKLSSHGYLQVQGDNVRIKVSDDFAAYYRQFVNKHFRIFCHSPAHGAHISLFLNKLHGKLDLDKIQELKKRYHNKVIRFSYDPYVFVGGGSKPFRNFFMKVEGFELDYIVQYLGIAGKNNCAHITVGNTKGGCRPYILK